MNAMYAPFCYIFNLFGGNTPLLALIVAIVLAIGIIMWLTDAGGKGLPIQLFITVAIGSGLLIGLPTMMGAMGMQIPC